MKKFITLALALIMTASFAGAQSRFGIKAGLNFNTLEDVTQSGSVDNAWKSQTGYHFGIAWQIKVPLLGIALQPELLYSKVKTHIADIPAEVGFPHLPIMCHPNTLLTTHSIRQKLSLTI